MKKAVIITSSIDVDNNYELTYSHKRSHFNSEERLRQTTYTVASIDSRFDKKTKIFLIDTSPDCTALRIGLSYQQNLEVISVKETFPEIYDIVRTHANKSHCESTLLYKLISYKFSELSSYDYVFKLSGRYFIDSSFNFDFINESNLDKFLFKNPLSFDWIDSWPLEIIDRRAAQNNNKLYQYSSVFYGVGKEKLKYLLDIYRAVSHITGTEKGRWYDLEGLLYFLTREFEKDIIETDWLVYGWDGTGGNFLRY